MIPDCFGPADDVAVIGPNAPTSVKENGFICGVVEGFYGRPWTADQRQKLFKRMNKMGLNTYLYAPKDDSKHRVYWRDLYTVEEADLLTTLIESAEEAGVTFVYAISPGLDITYSSSKEVGCLKRKLSQVASFGCKAFALLFDDIETELCEADKGAFQSFASAHVSVTNEVYHHLHKPSHFSFCPTEYCASRAVPTVLQSEYLNTVGTKLHPNIDVMWTGPKVISKKISIKSIEEVTKAIRRPPLIWDNIHANDYDHKRIFLGPYDGRSPELVSYIRGVLTNPNCEFEANYIALHTLAQWSRSNVGGVRKDCILSPATYADIKLETEGEFAPGEDCLINAANRYVPMRALKSAIADWHAEFLEKCNPPRKYIQPFYPVGYPTTAPTPNPAAANINNVCSTTIIVDKCTTVDPMTALEVGEGYIKPHVVNSLLETSASDSTSTSSDSISVELNVSEPMECAVTPSSTPVLESQSDTSTSLSEVPAVTIGALTEMQVDVTVSVTESFTISDVTVLVEMFYMPFEHGPWGVEALSEFHWLKSSLNSTLKEAEEWEQRCNKYIERLQSAIKVIERLCNVPNKALLHELFPYVWDLKALFITLCTFLTWLGHRCNRNSYGNYFCNGEREPWVFRGGLLGEFQRMLPFESAADLLFYASPTLPVCEMCNIRPYTPADKDAVYRVCLQTSRDGADGTEVYAQPEVIADKLVGAFLAYTPDTCFVVEDQQGICGYVLAASDAKAFFSRVESSWIPSMKTKYLKRSETMDTVTPMEEIIHELHSYKTVVPSDSLLGKHPSVLRVDMLRDRINADPTAPVRALACAVAALKMIGSCGVYTQVVTGDRVTTEAYRRLGFFEIPNQLQSATEGLVHLGRVI